MRSGTSVRGCGGQLYWGIIVIRKRESDRGRIHCHTGGSVRHGEFAPGTRSVAGDQVQFGGAYLLRALCNGGGEGRKATAEFGVLTASVLLHLRQYNMNTVRELGSVSLARSRFPAFANGGVVTRVMGMQERACKGLVAADPECPPGCGPSDPRDPFRSCTCNSLPMKTIVPSSKRGNRNHGGEVQDDAAFRARDSLPFVFQTSCLEIVWLAFLLLVWLEGPGRLSPIVPRRVWAPSPPPPPPNQ